MDKRDNNSAEQTPIHLLSSARIGIACILSLLIAPVARTAESASQVSPDDVPDRTSLVVSDRNRTARTVALSAIIDDAILADNVLAVRQRAAKLPEADRFEFLIDHVIPLSPRRIRLTGKFVPRRLVEDESNKERNSRNGGVLVSPLFDLLDLAAKTDRWNEFRQRLDAVVPGNEHHRRSKLALQIALALEIGDDAAAAEAFEVFLKMVHARTPASVYDQWPETLLAWRIVHRFPKWEPVGDLLQHLKNHRGKLNQPPNNDALHTHLWALASRYFADRRSAGIEINEERFAQWLRVERARSETRGLGFPASSWRWSQTKGGQHVFGHENDSLYFSLPLTGDFDVEADIDRNGQLQVLSAGLLIGKTWKNTGILAGNVRMGVRRQAIDPPFAKIERWLHYRAEYRGHECRIYLNGRLVMTVDRSDAVDPWVALRGWSRSDGAFRDVRITGTPQIPEKVELLEPKLNGWSDYFDKPSIPTLYAWSFRQHDESVGEIFGVHHPQLAGTHTERLFRYVRPINAEGSVEYEFYYKPQSALVHPAIDGMVFMLNSESADETTSSKNEGRVLIHRVTHGAYDQSELEPNNVGVPDEVTTDELPLVPNAWNRLKIVLKKDAVRLELNGKEICRHRLEEGNSRLPGLFYFSDRSEVRVRNMTMEGDWPRKLPVLRDQPFADHGVIRLDETRPQETFAFDFATSGLDQRYIDTAPGTTGTIDAVEGLGVVQVVNSPGKWTQSRLNPTFRMDGDFDATVRLGKLEISAQQYNGAGIVASIANGYEVEVYRRQQNADSQRVIVAWKEPAGDGEFRSSWQHISTEAMGGTFRIARRGDQVTALFAENDSSQFQIVGSRAIPGSEQHGAELRMQTIANDGGQSVATWESLTLQAEQLWHLPDPRSQPPITLFVMNADGSNLRQLTKTIPDRDSQGSPEWSPDGKRIAFDTWTGQADTSDMHIINADGTGLRRLGLGSMPSFSPTGDRLCCTSLLSRPAIMDITGQNREELDVAGWGFQWSPNGKWIAYESRHRENGRSQRNITLLDVKTMQQRQVLMGDDADRYSWIYYNMEWAPDSSQICFKGVVPGGSEVAIVNVANSSVKRISTVDLHPDFSWHPNGRSILVSGLLSQMGGDDPKASYSRKGHRLYDYDLDTDTFTLLPGQPMNQSSTNMAWSPDGQRITFVSRSFPGPVLWKGNPDVQPTESPLPLEE